MSSAKELRKKKKGKTVYKCPYCNFRGTKYKNVLHIEKVHPEMVPQGQTPAQVFFNYINKKTSGSCIICRRPTKWNENTWKYDRVCDNPTCIKKFKNSMSRGKKDKYGTDNLLTNPEFQMKMLENRGISGKYRFKDGEYKSYVGSYEKNLLEYFDKILNTKSKDILTPGPVIEYKFGDKTLSWITDIYYVPYNLIIEVKDGGDNKNNRIPEINRKKQIAKEHALFKLDKYNYIRLTNNNFLEFTSTLDRIKENMENDDNSIVFNVLEHTAGLSAVAAAPPPAINNKVYTVSQLRGNKVINTGITNDNRLKQIWFIDKTGYLNKKGIEDINTKYITRVTEDEDILENFNNLDLEDNKFIGYNPDYLFESIIGEDVIHPNDVLYDSRFESFVDNFKRDKYVIELLLNNSSIDNIEEFEITKYNKAYNDVKKIKSIYPNLDITDSLEGYIIKNINTNLGRLYKSLNEVTMEDLDIISGGEINV